MKPVFQNVLHRPSEGQYGNCFSAVLASALEIPVEDVPHFLHDGCDGPTWRNRINDFLRPLNLAFINIADAPTWMREHGVRGLMHEQVGETPCGSLHSTLAVDGEVVHDPMPGSLGLSTYQDNWGLFIVLDPSKPVGKPCPVRRGGK